MLSHVRHRVCVCRVWVTSWPQVPHRFASLPNGRVGESHRETGKLRSAAFLGVGRLVGGRVGETQRRSLWAAAIKLTLFFSDCTPSIVPLRNSQETLFYFWVHWIKLWNLRYELVSVQPWFSVNSVQAHRRSGFISEFSHNHSFTRSNLKHISFPHWNQKYYTHPYKLVDFF